jgi:hypothetical protein
VVAEFSEFRVLKYVRNRTGSISLPRSHRGARRGARALVAPRQGVPVHSPGAQDAPSMTEVSSQEAQIDQLLLL